MKYFSGLILGLCMSNIFCSITQVNEIAIQINTDIETLWQELEPCERVFTYYMWRASLPGNEIHADQCHRHSREIKKIFETIVSHKEQLTGHFKTYKQFDIAHFLQEAELYVTYLWTNHSQYFIREFENNKRTPSKLGLTCISPESLSIILDYLGYKNTPELLVKLKDSIFEAAYEPTSTVTGDILKSAVNFYSPDFKQVDYKNLSPQDSAQSSSYCYIDQKKQRACIETYSAITRYARELSVSAYWLRKAYEHARKHPNFFDRYFIKSLAYLIEFVQTGDEELFKKHSIEWIKSNSRLDYNYGFIEFYSDPMNKRGMFQAEVTIKAVDMHSLNTILPKLEANLPFDDAFMRESLSDTAALPNASINRKVFATGGLGPITFTAAYCLPNYDEIRSKYGSKQIIYSPDKSIGELLDADKYHRLFCSPAYIKWSEKYDPEFNLDSDLFVVQCILHETLGHGSGRLTVHTFKTGEDLTLDNITYEVGDTIPVTDENIKIFLAGYESTMEELRAEILALSSSIESYDELAQAGLFGKWSKKLSKEKMLELLIHNMAKSGLKRLLSQQEQAQEISGDHARANTTILNYLIDHSDLKITEDTVTIDGEPNTVLDIHVGDLSKACTAIKNLACEVQRIKSTADGLAIKELVDTYGKPIRNIAHLAAMHRNRKATMGNLKAVASLYPHMHPVMQDNVITDITISWPHDIVEQNQYFNTLSLSQEI